MKVTYAIDLDEINVNDSYENNMYLFEDTHQSDGGWDWDANLTYIDDENDTRLFIANLRDIELDVYFSNDSVDAAYWREISDDESIMEAISRGSIEIVEESNNHVKLKYNPDLSGGSRLPSLFTYIPDNELAILTLSNKAMSVNVYPPIGVENIANVIKEGVDQKTLQKKITPLF